MPLEPYMTAAVGLWLFAIGAAIGSFLNVVVYRLPTGQSLIHPGSRCPRCGHAIRWHDNLPIAGWLLLKGRCRDCRAPISPRYPLVELLVATMFIVLAAAQWTEATHRATPVEAPTHESPAPVSLRGDEPSATTALGDGGDAATSWELASDEFSTLAARYAFHLLLLCVLLTVGLMALDGGPLSIEMPRFYFVIGACILTIYLPALRPPADLLAGWVEPEFPRRAAAWESLASLWVGLLFNFAVRRAKLAPAARVARAPQATATMSYSGLWSVAIFLGGVAAAVVGLVAMLLTSLVVAIALGRKRPAGRGKRQPRGPDAPHDAATRGNQQAVPLAGVWLLSVWGATFLWLTGPALAGRPWPQWGFYGSWLLVAVACVALRGGCAVLRRATSRVDGG